MSPPERRVFLSPEADSDLDEILQFTLDIWGPTQMSRYSTRLNAGLQLLCAQPAMGRSRDDLCPGCRSFQIAEHVAFYVDSKAGIQVLRLAHKRMDVERLF